MTKEASENILTGKLAATSVTTTYDEAPPQSDQMFETYDVIDMLVNKD